MTIDTTSATREIRRLPGDEDELDLARYAALFWRYRWALLAAALLGGLVAAAMAWRAEVQYEATARLIVSPSKLGDVVTPASVGNYKILAEGQALAEETLSKFGLNRPPRSLGVKQFLEENLSVERLGDTNVIQLTVRLWDPVLAPRIANHLAEQAVALARTLSQDETVIARDIIKVQLNESQSRLDAAEARLKSFKHDQQVDVAKKDAEVVLDQRSQLQRLLVDMEVERARLAKAEELLKQQEEVRTVKRAVDPTAPVGLGQTEFRAEFLNPFVNPTYELLEQQVAQSRTRLSALEQQRQELAGRLKLGQAQLAQLSQLYAKEAELGRLEMEYDLAKRVYSDVATRYEQARLQVAGRSVQLQVLDSAQSPADRVGRQITRKVGIAVALSLLLAFVAVLIHDRVTRPNA